MAISSSMKALMEYLPGYTAESATRGCRKLHSEELHNFDSSSISSMGNAGSLDLEPQPSIEDSARFSPFV
jgi:hypothetical protein